MAIPCHVMILPILSLRKSFAVGLWIISPTKSLSFCADYESHKMSLSPLVHKILGTR